MLGIIGAMDEEVAKVKEQMEDVETKQIASMEFLKGTGSCGNESFGGKVIYEMACLFRKMDPYRLVQIFI